LTPPCPIGCADRRQGDTSCVTDRALRTVRSRLGQPHAPTLTWSFRYLLWCMGQVITPNASVFGVMFEHWSTTAAGIVSAGLSWRSVEGFRGLATWRRERCSSGGVGR
jgi:hypothetical protein